MTQPLVATTYDAVALPLRRRLPVWLLLACTSVWLAEVTATSSRFPFLTAPGWLMLVPLYGLHTLVGGWLVMRAHRLTWPVVYLPGVLFGLYEAYLTKVLWSPTWFADEWQWVAGGVHVGQTLSLVLFWHPLLAFVLPLALVERAVTGSSEVLAVLPRPLRWLVGGRWGIVVLGVLAGTYSAVNATWLVALGSAATTIVLVLALREVVVRSGTPSLRAVLPTNRQAAWLGGMLLAGYLVLGFGMRPEAVPPVWPGQVTVWVMYAVVAGLYMVALRRSRTLPFVLAPAVDPPSRRPLLALGLAFTAAATLAALVPGPSWLAYATLLGGTLACTVGFVVVAVRTLQPRG